MKRIAPIAVLAALAGCGGGGPAPGFHAALPPAPSYTAPPPEPSSGAIYQAYQGYGALHEGLRARRVGDIVTVVLVEAVSARKDARSRSDRTGNAGILPPVAGPLNFLTADALNAGSNGSFNGRGDAAQSSRLDGALAVTIREVRPNGTALVAGEKLMSVSQGREWMQFSGIVRLADIDADNRIASVRVADARILYSGDGAVQRASRPGWLSRFFGAVSPF